MGNKLIRFVKKNLILDFCWLTVSVYIGLKIGIQEGTSFERQEVVARDKVTTWAQMASAQSFIIAALVFLLPIIGKIYILC